MNNKNDKAFTEDLTEKFEDEDKEIDEISDEFLKKMDMLRKIDLGIDEYEM